MDDLRTPQEWCDLLGIEVLDADGWRWDNKPWDEPITEEEFVARSADCTIRFRRLEGV